MGIGSRIAILPDYIANQIAAGEVVQRPESVVKELVENSLDSEATEIAVIIQDGGKQLISVIDNGFGMSRADLEIAIKRHSTSKIKTQEDLENIMTFGFRGEALASISSVADLEIRTRLKNEAHGWKLISEPMKQQVIEPFNQEQGTQVFVRNLFYNVPARKKFLKSKLTEIRYISDTLIRFSLAHPDLRFTFYSDDTLIFDVKPSSLKERLEHILGSSSKDGFMELNYQNELMKISGYIGKPLIAKPNNSGQYLFVNRRPIESRNLSFAIFSAFEHLLEKKYKPVFVLNLQINPERIDVNIHPQKNEVKFDNENYVYNTLRKAVSLVLADNNLMTNIEINGRTIDSPFVRITDETNNNESILINQVTGEIISSQNIAPPGFSQSHHNFDLPKREGSFKDNYFIPHKQDEFNSRNFNSDNFNKLLENKLLENKLLEPSEASSNELTNVLFITTHKQSIEEIKKDLPFANYFQLHNKYIIVQVENGMIIVDQHNAHERVIFERVSESFSSLLSNNQELIFPVEIQFKIAYIALLNEIKEEVEKIGFKYEIIEPDTVKLFAIPKDVALGKEAEILSNILEDYLINLQVKQTAKRDKIIATYSCKAAIKTGERLTSEKMKQLVIDLFNCKIPYVCPHGRPVVLEMSLKDLDKQFGRI
jgi:DNA mismatch repair protein MutL